MGELIHMRGKLSDTVFEEKQSRVIFCEPHLQQDVHSDLVVGTRGQRLQHGHAHLLRLRGQQQAWNRVRGVTEVLKCL